jgi:hypothetical protein
MVCWGGLQFQTYRIIGVATNSLATSLIAKPPAAAAPFALVHSSGPPGLSELQILQEAMPKRSLPAEFSSTLDEDFAAVAGEQASGIERPALEVKARL